MNRKRSRFATKEQAFQRLIDIYKPTESFQYFYRKIVDDFAGESDMIDEACFDLMRTSEKPYLMTGISYFCDNDAIANASAYFAASPYAPVNSYVIFARNNGGGGVSYQTSAKLYRLRMWCDGSLVRDFIPAMRNSDSKIGLYDNVNNVFYQNQGTGNFTGAVVQ